MEMQTSPALETVETLPAPPDEINVPDPAPKRRGRPVKAAPPAIALWREYTRRGVAGTLTVSRDDASGFDVTVAAVGGDVVRVRYTGPSDRAIPQELAQSIHNATRIDGEPSAAAMRYPDAVALPAGVAADAIAFVECAASRDITRYNLNGICLDPAGILIGTDGHRLHKITGLASPFSRDVIVPRAAVVTVLRAIKATKAAVLEIGHDPAQPSFIWFRCAGESLTVELRARLVDGQFPDWRQVILTRDSYTVDTEVAIPDVQALRACLETAPVKIDKPCRSRTFGITRPADGGDAVCISHDRKERVSIPVDVVRSGEAFTVTLNSDYIDDALAHMVCGAVLYTAADGLTPVVIENGDRVAVIMPMRA